MGAGNTSYPGALDTTTNLPIASALVSTELDGDGNANKVHSNLHGVLSEAAVAIEAKIGTGASTPVANRVLRGSGTGTSAWAQVALATDVSGTLPLANGGTAATSASGARTALGLGTAAVAATGISNTNVPVFTSGVADDDFLRVAGTNVEGRSAAEVLSDIGAGAVAGSGSIVTTGALNSGSITSGFTSIDVGAGAITTTGALSIASMGTNWTNAGRTVADMGIVTTIDINGGTINGITDLVVADGGTGVSTFTDHGVLLGSGTAAVSVTDAGTSGQVLTSGGSGADPDWANASSGGGITEADVFTLATGLQGDANPITANMVRVANAGFSKIGTGISASGGVFSFPSTGIYEVTYHCAWWVPNGETADPSVTGAIEVTLNNSSYATVVNITTHTSAHNQYAQAMGTTHVDVTNVSNVKFRVTSRCSGTIETIGGGGGSGASYVWVRVVRLGDT